MSSCYLIVNTGAIQPPLVSRSKNELGACDCMGDAASMELGRKNVLYTTETNTVAATRILIHYSSCRTRPRPPPISLMLESV